MSYRNEIARQPQMAEHVIGRVKEELSSGGNALLQPGLTAVTGIGASYEAAVVAAAGLAHRGQAAVAVRAVDLAEARPIFSTIFAVSAGGRSIEPVQAIRSNPQATSLGISREGNNPLSEAATSHISFDSGSDATPSSTGYTGSLIAAGMIIDRVMERPLDDWESMPDLIGSSLAATVQKLDDIGEVFRERRAIDCVGAGAAMGTAGGAALLIREAARIPAWAIDTLHYLHGPMEPMDASTAVVVIGNGREVKLAKDMAQIGCAVLLITQDTGVQDEGSLCVVHVPAVGDLVQQEVLNILPAQLLAAQLSDQAGLTDVKFRYRQTDTKIQA